jgi:hypothetical protein
MDVLNDRIKQGTTNEREFTVLEPAAAWKSASAEGAHVVYSDWIKGSSGQPIRRVITSWYFTSGGKLFDFQVVSDQATYDQYGDELNRLVDTLKINPALTAQTGD